jgi:hypothetical protein
MSLITPDEIKKRRILVKDDSFKTINDTRNAFELPSLGDGIKKAEYPLENKRYIWFPKIAIKKDGALVPPKEELNWLNTLSSDQTELLERWIKSGTPNEAEYFNDPKLEIGIFAKLTEDQKYTFLGVYKTKEKDPDDDTIVFRRIACYLNIDDWIAGK